MNEPRKVIRWLRKQWGKKSGHNLVFDGRDEVGEGTDHWLAREPFSDTFVEAYANMETEVRVQLIAGRRPADARRYLAVYRSMGGHVNVSEPGAAWFSLPKCASGSVYGTDCDEQAAVLVDVVKLAEFTQPTAYIPSLVRLYILDDLPGLRTDTGNREGQLPPVLPSLPWWAIADREARSIARRLLVEHDELIRKMIKGTAEVVYAVPEYQLGIWIQDRWIIPPIQVVSSVIPYLTREGLGVGMREGFKDFFQIVSVGFGSTDLVSDPIEGRLLAAFHGLALESDVKGTGRPGADAGDTGGSQDPGADAPGCAP